MMRKMEAEFHPALMHMAASLWSIPAPNTCEADRGLADSSPPTTEPARLIPMDNRPGAIKCHTMTASLRTSTGPKRFMPRERRSCTNVLLHRRKEEFGGSSAVLRRPRFGQTGSPDPRCSTSGRELVCQEILGQICSPDHQWWCRSQSASGSPASLCRRDHRSRRLLGLTQRIRPGALNVAWENQFRCGRSWPDLTLDPERELPIGAHVVTPRRGYTHHGIYVGRGRVVQYGGLFLGLRRGPVEEVALLQFARGRAIWLRLEESRQFDRDEVVHRARARLGEDRYNVLTNNCEHFCEWCVRGEPRSHQVDELVTRYGRAWRRLVELLARVLCLRS